MVEAPFCFFEMIVKVFPTHSSKFCQAEFCKAPEGFDSVDMAAASGEFIVVMVNAIMLVALQKQTVISPPTIGVDRALSANDLSPDDAHQFFLRAVQNRSAEYFSPPLEQTYDRYFPSCSPAPQSSNASRTKVAFVHFHTTGEGSRLGLSQINDPGAQQAINPMRCVLINSDKFTCR